MGQQDSQELRDAVAKRQAKITRLQLGPGHAAKCANDFQASHAKWPVDGRHPYVVAQEGKGE